MVESRKAIGYFISKNRCLKAYVKYNAKTKKYSKTRYNSKGKPIKKGTRVFKTKDDCNKKIKLMQKKEKLKKQKPKREKSRKNKFGQEKDICYNSAPYFGTLVPVISPLASGTRGTGFSSVSHHWPEGLAKTLQKQSYITHK